MLGQHQIGVGAIGGNLKGRARQGNLPIKIGIEGVVYDGLRPSQQR